MAHRRAVRKQQDTSRLSRQALAAGASAPAAKAVEDPLAHLRPIADAFNAAVAQCVQDADPEAVHRLRTGSRRLQATLEAMLRETGAAGDALQQPARAWLRQLKLIRRAAGPVRDLDVQRKLLENWMGNRATEQDQASVNGQVSPAPAQESNHGSDASPLRSHAEMLDAWLKGERKRLAPDMQKQIKKRQRRLTEGQGALFAAVDRVRPDRSRAPRSAATVALEAFVRVTDAMPLLHAENLHDFRKSTKQARYVAEAGGEEQNSSNVARALKRIQDAIGDWHDWLYLAEEAGTALGQDATELTASLEREVERHFAAAIKTTQSMRGRLVGEWMAGHGGKAFSQSPVKRPPAAIGDRRLASSF